MAAACCQYIFFIIPISLPSVFNCLIISSYVTHTVHSHLLNLALMSIHCCLEYLHPFSYYHTSLLCVNQIYNFILCCPINFELSLDFKHPMLFPVLIPVKTFIHRERDSFPRFVQISTHF